MGQTCEEREALGLEFGRRGLCFLHGLVCCVNTAGSEKALNKFTTDRRISNTSVL
jgi:hypothetical protein